MRVAVSLEPVRLLIAVTCMLLAPPILNHVIGIGMNLSTMKVDFKMTCEVFFHLKRKLA